MKTKLIFLLLCLATTACTLHERTYFIPVTVHGHWSPADGVTWSASSAWVDPWLDFEGMESPNWCCTTSLQLQAIRMPGYRHYAEVSRPIPTLLQGCVDVYEERYAAAFDFEIDLRVPETLVP
jgi:hypothetical protein